MIRILLTLSLVASVMANAGPLETARHLSETTYKEWTYGAKASEKQIDCVQFMAAVIAEKLGRPLTLTERNAININHGWSSEEVQSKAKAGTDPLVSGLVHALVDLMRVGKQVSAAEAKPGDFVQYWKRNAEGRWFGHASLLSSVTDGKARLYGSHKSSNGIAESSFELLLEETDRHVFLARLDEGVRSRMQVSRDGTIWLPRGMATKDQDALRWTLEYKRWGMVDLQAHFHSSAEPNDYTLQLVDGTLDGNVRMDAVLRVYLPRAGSYPITFRGVEKIDVQALSLTPAPEGREDLQEVDGKVILNSRDATVWGHMLRYEPNPKKLCLGYWANPNDYADWRFHLDQPGTFVVEIDQGCGKGHGGSPAYVAHDGQELAFTVQDTGGFQNFVTRRLGRLTIAVAGSHVIKVAAHGKAKGAVMDVSEIRLVRQ